jgi:hypothetical protein
MGRRIRSDKGPRSAGWDYRRAACCLFVKALNERGITLPDRRETLIFYCGDVATDILNGSIREPTRMLAKIWKVLLESNYPPVLRTWRELIETLDIMEDQGEGLERMEEEVRATCRRFLPILEGYAETGLARVTYRRSIELLGQRGSDVATVGEMIPKSAPSRVDEGKRLAFFRTRVEKGDFQDLTLPRTLFLRSEISECQFSYADLLESSMTWCSWTRCWFWSADLRGCDLRRSIFRDCHFYDAMLDGADLRGARFVNCHISGANMKNARMRKAGGIFRLTCGLKLSPDQKKQIQWIGDEEPPGG